jgi:hypothetical protein
MTFLIKETNYSKNLNDLFNFVLLISLECLSQEFFQP